MFKTIVTREVQHNLYSLRFQISLGLVLAIFVAGSLSFVKSHEAALKTYREYGTQIIEAFRADAGANATVLAVNHRTYVLRPRDNGFIADAKERYLPNAIVYSAWNVFGFENRSGSTNPFLVTFDELNWAFIAGLVASFIALLFTFDAVSGEKETKTLALALSNSFSRGTLLAGKYASAVFTVMAVLLPGIIVSALIILLSGGVAVDSALAMEAAGFVVVTGLLVAVMAAFGLLASVASRNVNVSLLIALSLWLLFAVVIPNSSLFVAKNAFAVERAEAVRDKVNRAFEDLNKNAPKGSWMMHSSNPFLPQHKLRADLQMKRLTAEKQIRDAYYGEMFRQFERTRLVSLASPVSLFEYLTEAVVGGGYPRFRKVWQDVHTFQSQFLNFYMALDIADKASPHWYNPNEDVSTTRKPVAFEKVPQFTEKPMSLGERAASVLRYLVIGVFYACAVFLVTYVLFVRYDVR